MKKLKIYKHTGPGIWIGSCVIVVARSLEEASVLIGRELNNHGLYNEELDIVEVPIKEGAVVLSDNGDY